LYRILPSNTPDKQTLPSNPVALDGNKEKNMKVLLTRSETSLALALVMAVAVACVGPTVAQHAHYHAFADQRMWHGFPYAMDVLSNLPFAVGGVWGLLVLQRMRPGSVTSTQGVLALVFFVGLLCTAVCSSVYHWNPDNTGLAIDRLGMVVAFAGLLGLAAADRVSARAGLALAGTVLLLGPLSVYVWATTGNLLAWVVLQGGGMLLVVLLALVPPTPGAWGIPLVAVIAIYTVAKLLELEDHTVFAWTHGLVSGHSLKHGVAALAAWPVISVMHNVAQGGLDQVKPRPSGVYAA
jgi:hypothetical protein